MHRLSVPGAQIHYDMVGKPSNPALLMLHALGSSAAMWDAQVEALADHFRLVLPSARGHGASTVEDFRELDIATLATDALAVLDALELTKVHCCGLSLGGCTAMWMAHAQPGRIDRLVLAHTAAHMPPRELWLEREALVRREGMAALAEPTMERWFTADFRAAVPASVIRIRDLFLATDPEGYASICTALRDMDQREAIRSIGAPTLVIEGTAEPQPARERARELASSIPGARLLPLDAAHLGNIEREREFNAALLEHLTA